MDKRPHLGEFPICWFVDAFANMKLASAAKETAEANNQDCPQFVEYRLRALEVVDY